LVLTKTKNLHEYILCYVQLLIELLLRSLKIKSKSCFD